MRIGELSARSGVSRDTLRFYEKRGLIAAIRRPNGYRHYGDAALQIIGYIRTAQRLGFTLAEIEGELPALASDTKSPSRLARALMDKMALIDTRIAELQVLRADLAARLDLECPLEARS